MVLLWALLGGGLSVGLEYAYRQHIDWFRNIWWILPAAVLLNFSVYKLLQGEFTWLYSIVFFSATTAVLRIALVFLVQRDPPSPANIAASVVLLAGVAIRLVWR